MNIFNLKVGNNPLDIIEDINKVKSRIKRNSQYIDDKKKIENELVDELNKLTEKYYLQTQKEVFISLEDLIVIFGEESVNKAIPKLKHISKIKDDCKWIQSKIPCWVCSVDSHMNVCHENEKCDRGIKCIGTKVLLIQVKEEEGKLF